MNLRRFQEACRAAGIGVKALQESGTLAGRAVLLDGTIIPAANEADQTLRHERGKQVDVEAANVFKALREAHDPTPDSPVLTLIDALAILAVKPKHESALEAVNIHVKRLLKE